jgi:PhzF family phenazine biosynthesis protein
MKINIYHVDAFTDKLFSGNPAAVCPLSGIWPDDSILQCIAFENNLAETGFYLPDKSNYHIRWFTPSVEVDLCGHGTLAAAHVLFNHENHEGDNIYFNSRSGILNVKKENDLITLDFPSDKFERIKLTEEVTSCFNIAPVDAFKGKTDYMIIFKNEDQILNIKYDLTKIRGLKARGVIITARGNECDFVSRFFAPQSGIDEDPVTGSAHTTLIPYWSGVLNRQELTAIQLSARRGYLICRNKNDRVEISGKSRTYMTGEIII